MRLLGYTNRLRGQDTSFRRESLAGMLAGDARLSTTPDPWALFQESLA